MDKPSPSRMSAARRNAETILSQSRKWQDGFKLEQERAREAMTQKTARLRELRLAKAAAEREVVASAPSPATKPRKSQRSKPNIATS
jgi:hypothetical protein